MKVNKGADEIDLYYFGRSHRNGDAWVVFPALRLMHAGDIFRQGTSPLLDANNGGSGVEIATRSTRRKSVNIDTVITGHSTTMTMADPRVCAVQQGLHDRRQAPRRRRGSQPTRRRRLEDSREVPSATRRPPKRASGANVQIVYDETK